MISSGSCPFAGCCISSFLPSINHPPQYQPLPFPPRPRWMFPPTTGTPHKPSSSSAPAVVPLNGLRGARVFCLFCGLWWWWCGFLWPKSWSRSWVPRRPGSSSRRGGRAASCTRSRPGPQSRPSRSAPRGPVGLGPGPWPCASWCRTRAADCRPPSGPCPRWTGSGRGASLSGCLWKVEGKFSGKKQNYPQACCDDVCWLIILSLDYRDGDDATAFMIGWTLDRRRRCGASHHGCDRVTPLSFDPMTSTTAPKWLNRSVQCPWQLWLPMVELEILMIILHFWGFGCRPWTCSRHPQ